MSDTRRLGRGLEALLGPVTREAAQASGALRELPVSAIKPNPFQPRTTFNVISPREGGQSMSRKS